MMDLSIPAAASGVIDISPSQGPLTSRALSARVNNQNKLADVCWKVGRAARKSRIDVEAKKFALDAIAGYRSDILEYKNRPPVSAHQLSKRNWTAIEILKFGLIAGGALLTLAVTVLNIYNLISGKSSLSSNIANTVITTVVTVGLVFVAIGQAGLDTHTRVKTIQTDSDKDEELRFFQNIDVLLQNIEWTLETYETNPELCYKFIGACYICLKKFPPDFVENNEHIKMLIQNLVHLLPTEDRLRKTLLELGSHETLKMSQSGKPSVQEKEKGKAILRASHADMGLFLEPALSPRDRIQTHSKKSEEIIQALQLQEENIWNRVETMLGVKVDDLYLNGVTLQSARRMEESPAAAAALYSVSAAGPAGGPLTIDTYPSPLYEALQRDPDEYP